MKKAASKKGFREIKSRITAQANKLNSTKNSNFSGESLSDILGIRVAPSFKKWVMGEMAKMGVPDRAKAEFLRGCLAFAIKASQRINDPKWVSFAEASEAVAIEKLGAKLALEGPRDIAALGFWSAT